MTTWATLNNGKPVGTDVADITVIADRIDNVEKGLDGTDDLDNISITGGNVTGAIINGSTIGASSPSTGAFTTLTATTCDMNGGSIDGTTVGASSASTGAFTTLTASSTLDVTGVTTATGGIDAGGSGTVLKFKVLSETIDGAGAAVTFTHGLTADNIRGISNMSFAIVDAGAYWYFQVPYNDGTRVHYPYKITSTTIIGQWSVSNAAAAQTTVYITVWYEA